MSLYAYQEAGVQWLLRHPRSILADEMGLGKTREALVALQRLRLRTGEPLSALVVCPLSLTDVWRDECAALGMPESAWPAIVTYNRIKTGMTAYVVIVDEAHYVRNRDAKRSRAMRGLAGRAKLLWFLTGTAMINNVGDMWHLLHMICPTTFRSYWNFVDLWANKALNPFTANGIRVLPGAKEPRAFARMLAPYVLRRTKAEVGIELPPVTRQVISCTMTSDQRDLHDDCLREAIVLYGQSKVVIPNPAVALLRARQACVSPQLLDPAGEAGPKIAALVDLLDSADGRTVVFSSWLGPLRLAHALRPGVLFYGALTEKQRASALTQWRSQARLPLYMTIDTGGVGLTLTDASTVIFLDEPWTPAQVDQAVARLHRIGQINPVTAYFLRCKASVEDHVVAILTAKETGITDILRSMLRAKGQDKDVHPV